MTKEHDQTTQKNMNWFDKLVWAIAYMWDAGKVEDKGSIWMGWLAIAVLLSMFLTLLYAILADKLGVPFLTFQVFEYKWPYWVEVSLCFIVVRFFSKKPAILIKMTVTGREQIMMGLLYWGEWWES